MPLRCAGSPSPGGSGSRRSAVGPGRRRAHARTVRNRGRHRLNCPMGCRRVNMEMAARKRGGPAHRGTTTMEGWPQIGPGRRVGVRHPGRHAFADDIRPAGWGRPCGSASTGFPAPAAETTWDWQGGAKLFTWGRRSPPAHPVTDAAEKVEAGRAPVRPVLAGKYRPIGESLFGSSRRREFRLRHRPAPTRPPNDSSLWVVGWRELTGAARRR